MSVRVNADNFEAEVLQSEIPVLADFYSDGCVPCKRMSPVLAEIEEEYEGRLKVVKVNIGFDGELAEKYEVQAAPTFVFFKNGEEKERIRGAVKKAEIIDKINNLD
jgi:thioredoxin 1